LYFKNIFKKNKKIYYQKVIRAILIEPMKSQQLVVHLFFLEVFGHMIGLRLVIVAKTSWPDPYFTFG
jgi:hypothetical protein